LTANGNVCALFWILIVWFLWMLMLPIKIVLWHMQGVIGSVFAALSSDWFLSSLAAAVDAAFQDLFLVSAKLGCKWQWLCYILDSDWLVPGAVDGTNQDPYLASARLDW
jgi:hypothetical protein